MEEIRNRVSESKSLVVFDLEDYFPPAGISEFDLAPMLENGVMREKKCRDLIDKPSEYSKCIANFGKELGSKGLKKLNTDSKLTDWIKKKIRN